MRSFLNGWFIPVSDFFILFCSVSKSMPSRVCFTLRVFICLCCKNNSRINTFVFVSPCNCFAFLFVFGFGSAGWIYLRPFFSVSGISLSLVIVNMLRLVSPLLPRKIYPLSITPRSLNLVLVGNVEYLCRYSKWKDFIYFPIFFYIF